jgi:hypothetical protein
MAPDAVDSAEGIAAEELPSVVISLMTELLAMTDLTLLVSDLMGVKDVAAKDSEVDAVAPDPPAAVPLPSESFCELRRIELCFKT